MKIIFKIIKAVVILLLAVFLIMNLPWIMIGVGGMLSPAPPKPEITYGEFSFKIVYEINGEEITVEDAVICEFDGIGWNEGTGKYRKWVNG